MPAIDTDAFLRDLHELRKIGQFRTGRTSTYFLAAGHGIATLAF